MADIDPAVEWLETDWERNHPFWGDPHRDGVVVRPMFQILTDHVELPLGRRIDLTRYNPDEHCWCSYEDPIVIEPGDDQDD